MQNPKAARSSVHLTGDITSFAREESDGEEEETDSLLPSSRICHRFSDAYTFIPDQGHVKTIDEDEGLLEQGITDNMMYLTRKLTTWDAFTITYSAVWVNRTLWVMMLKLSAVAICVSVLTVLLVPNPAVLKVSKFTEVSKFLNVIVGLLLGFFMSSSMKRYHDCVNGFLQLLDSIRNLQMQFTALGVPEAETILCMRYSFSSAWLLYGQLLVETKRGDAQRDERERMWDKMRHRVARIDRTGNTMMLSKHEVEVLKMTRDPPGMMWMWVAALIGRLAQDGWVPPMPTPTYGRVMNLCQAAHAGIREVRAAISLQAPLTYTHMLSTLVHINNFLNALTFGLVSGLAIGTTLVAHNIHIYKYMGVRNLEKADASMNESEQDLQNIVVTFLYCFFGPLLYQALLIISMQLAQPFDTDDAKIPMHRLLHMLEVDMCNGRDLVDHMPFDRPAFKQQEPGVTTLSIKLQTPQSTPKTDIRV